MFTNMRFEPAGMTDDPDIRFATSLVDYIFRRLAVEYLPTDKREATGHPDGGGAARSRRCPVSRRRRRRARTSHRPAARGPRAVRRARRALAPPAPPAPAAPTAREREVVLCHVCGDMMQRAGSLLRLPELRQHERLLVM